MDITSAQYLKTGMTNENSGLKVIIDGQIFFVPLSEDNRYYTEIMRQVEAGELTIADAD